MDVALLQKCQSEGPSPATFEKFVADFPAPFSGVDAAKCAKNVEERLLFLMEKLEAMQDDGEASDSTEEEEEEDEEGEEGDA